MRLWDLVTRHAEDVCVGVEARGVASWKLWGRWTGDPK